ncbi:proteophosphoglycan ppg4 [Gracilaria domingensis]|nr:proteophosphoglycan ppg4 [Gracilaria domingensis]
MLSVARDVALLVVGKAAGAILVKGGCYGLEGPGGGLQRNVELARVEEALQGHGAVADDGGLVLEARDALGARDVGALQKEGHAAQLDGGVVVGGIAVGDDGARLLVRAARRRHVNAELGDKLGGNQQNGEDDDEQNGGVAMVLDDGARQIRQPGVTVVNQGRAVMRRQAIGREVAQDELDGAVDERDDDEHGDVDERVEDAHAHHGVSGVGERRCARVAEHGGAGRRDVLAEPRAARAVGAGAAPSGRAAARAAGAGAARRRALAARGGAGALRRRAGRLLAAAAGRGRPRRARVPGARARRLRLGAAAADGGAAHDSGRAVSERLAPALWRHGAHAGRVRHALRVRAAPRHRAARRLVHRAARRAARAQRQPARQAGDAVGAARAERVYHAATGPTAAVAVAVRRAVLAAAGVAAAPVAPPDAVQPHLVRALRRSIAAVGVQPAPVPARVQHDSQRQ